MMEYMPPMTVREITIDGFAVPHIEARESEDGLNCHIMLDRRFGAIIPAVNAQEVLWLLANALAVGAGYSCHGENSCVSNPYKVRVSEITSR